MPEASLVPWTDEEPPTPVALEEILRKECLAPSWWSNGPGDRYSTHSHSYHRVLFCARGSIRFTLQTTGEALDLAPGDRLDLPPGTPHSAVVGAPGVTCVEGARR